MLRRTSGERQLYWQCTSQLALTYNGDALFYPKYKTPIAYQMNIGVQQEIMPRTFVVTADFLRNVSVHTLLSIDENKIGDARYLDVSPWLRRQ